MIRFEPVPEPPEFDAKARQPGKIWLATHPGTKRPRDLWSPFKAALADGFCDLCGYSAMYEPVGTVDHYKSWKGHPELAYEWSNYRYAAAWINSAKQDLDGEVLDPFEVGEGWFEILLPSLQLVMTDSVPAPHRERAQRTIERLHLGHDERIIRQRQAWYRMYIEHKLTLEGLHDLAPLLARAVEKSSTR
jgi:hypothetical protein